MTITFKHILLSLTALMIAAAANGKLAVTAITADNAAKALPKALMLQHCGQIGYGPKDCDPMDFSGVAVDLDSNGLPEFTIVNKKIEGGDGKTCTLYRDEKARFALIQRDFPCEIGPLDHRTSGWLDIKGTIYPTNCEPLTCDFTWTGSSYHKGACAPKNSGTCGAE